MTCTRSPYVLDSLRRLSPPGTPRNSLWLLRCLIEATSIFTMPEALWPHFAANPPNAFSSSCLCPHGFRSRAQAYWTLRRLVGWDLWHLCRKPFFLFALTSPSCVVSSPPACPYDFGTPLMGRKSEEPAKTIFATDPWRSIAVDDPRRLPSTGTLRRIRWPLQPRSRDRLTAFGAGATAGWRSHVTLGLVPIPSRCGPTRSEMRFVLSLDALADVWPPTLAPT